MDNQQPSSNDARFDRLEALILSVRSDADVKKVAEEHGALVDNIAKINDGIGRLEAGQERLKLRMLAVESRLDELERPAWRRSSRRL